MFCRAGGRLGKTRVASCLEEEKLLLALNGEQVCKLIRNEGWAGLIFLKT